MVNSSEMTRISRYVGMYIYKKKNLLTHHRSKGNIRFFPFSKTHSLRSEDLKAILANLSAYDDPVFDSR